MFVLSGVIDETAHTGDAATKFLVVHPWVDQTELNRAVGTCQWRRCFAFAVRLHWSLPTLSAAARLVPRSRSVPLGVLRSVPMRCLWLRLVRLAAHPWLRPRTLPRAPLLRSTSGASSGASSVPRALAGFHSPPVSPLESASSLLLPPEIEFRAKCIFLTKHGVEGALRNLAPLDRASAAGVRPRDRLDRRPALVASVVDAGGANVAVMFVFVDRGRMVTRFRVGFTVGIEIVDRYIPGECTRQSRAPRDYSSTDQRPSL